MSAEAFDRKFGEALLGSVGTGPGVYQYLDADGVVLYVGKAKNLRRRLSSYRNASRRKAHRKMRRIVKAATALHYEEVESEEAALLRENELIAELRPKLNVDGAFAFLYPAIGVGRTEKQTILVFSTSPESYKNLNLAWYGTFRSRLRAKAAFDALVELLGIIGHREKSRALAAPAAQRGSRVVGLRQLPLELVESLPWFFGGEDPKFLGELARSLLSKPRARRDASQVQEHLVALRDFYERDAVRLRAALRKLGRPGSFISQAERDALFIRAKYGKAETT